MSVFARNLLVIISLVVLTACQTSKKENVKFDAKNFHITSVDVKIRPDAASKHKSLQPTESLDRTLTNTIKKYVAEYNAARPNPSARYKLKVDVTKVHYKNAITAFIIDNNRIKGIATVVDPRSGKTVHKTSADYTDAVSTLQVGVSGAVLAVVIKRELVEAKLAKGVAKNITELVYPGVELSEAAKKRLKKK